MLRACYTEFSLEECKSRFLFGIITVIRQPTSSPLAETHSDYVSYNDNTVPPVFTAETPAATVPFKLDQTSSAASELTALTEWSPCRCDRKFV